MPDIIAATSRSVSYRPLLLFLKALLLWKMARCQYLQEGALNPLAVKKVDAPDRFTSISCRAASFFSLLTSMELILIQNCSLFYLDCNEINSFKCVSMKKIIDINELD